MHNIKEQCELFIKYKYEYYILNAPTVSDEIFDILEDDLRKTNDVLAMSVVDIIDFPSYDKIKQLGLNINNIAPCVKIKSDDVKYKHWTKMRSIAKLQVNDETNIPYNKINLFLNRRTSSCYECSCKYDGNAISLMYVDGILMYALTRGDGEEGLDRIMKMKLIVPNKISLKGEVEIRGEVCVDRNIWKEKYYDEENVSNERNFVGGILAKDLFNVEEINDLTFVAYSLVGGGVNAEYVNDSMSKLKELGFNANHDPFIRYIKNSNDFDKMYFDFKEYRQNCNFLLDGIVIKFPENLRGGMISKTKYPAWSLAIKFKSVYAETVLEEFVWSQGKNNKFTPIAILSEVELGGTMNTRASCHNLSYVIKHGAFPGCIVKIRKAGEIINQVVEVVEKSPDHDAYVEMFEDFYKNNHEK